jgi:hypothetical protein
MAEEFDPITRKAVADDTALRIDPVERERGGLGMLGISAVAAVVLVLGLLFWNMSDRTNTTAMTIAPGVTTGSSTATPATPPTGTAPPASR